MKIVITEIQLKKLLESRGGHNKSSTEKFIKKAQEVHKNLDGAPKYDYSLVDYVGDKTKVKVICPEHEKDMIKTFGVNYFEVFPNIHKQGKGICPFENKRKERKYTDDDMKLAASQVSNKTEFENKFSKEYYSARQRNKTLPGFYEEITGHFDSLKRESYGEKEVGKILDDLSIKYEREYEFTDCTNTKDGRFCRKLPFDFYLPESNTCIEYDGEQHFRESNLYGPKKFLAAKENDKLKDNFCKKNNIKLIRLHYKLKNLEDNLKDALSSSKNFILKGPY